MSAKQIVTNLISLTLLLNIFVVPNTTKQVESPSKIEDKIEEKPPIEKVPIEKVPIEKPPIEKPPITSEKYGKVNVEELDIKSAPSDNSTLITKIPKDTLLEILETKGVWYRIKVGNSDAWVYTGYVDIINKPSIDILPITSEKYGKVNVEELDVRSAASDDSTLITRISKDTLLEILETKGVWYRIKVDNSDAWIYSSYVDIISKPSTILPITSEKYGKVNVEELDIKSDPSDNSTLITKIPKDTLLEILETKGVWYRIKVGNSDAWVYSSYVDIISKPSTIPPITSEKYGKVNVEELDVRSAASDDSTLITRIPKDTLLEILETKGVWYRIKVDNSDAWVYSSYIDIISKPSTEVQPIEIPSTEEIPVEETNFQ